MGRVLALDPGERRIGAALSDPMRIIASPLTTITVKPREKLRGELQELIRGHDVDTVIVGFPVREDGYEGRGCARSRALVELLEGAGVEVVLWDEAYTTARAVDALRRGGVGRRRARAKTDAVAASFILSSYLEEVERDG